MGFALGQTIEAASAGNGDEQITRRDQQVPPGERDQAGHGAAHGVSGAVRDDRTVWRWSHNGGRNAADDDDSVIVRVVRT